MTEHSISRGGTGHSHSTTYTSSVSVTEGAANRESGLHGRAHAAVIVQEITQMLEELAAAVPTRDFVWARLAIDICFDDILFGHQMD